MKKILLFVILFCSPIFAADVSLLQDISVTITTNTTEGSGTIITRDIDVGGKTEKINFVWTAGHVVEGLRQVTDVIDANGNTKKVVTFKTVSIVKELTEKGMRVGELKMDARVIKYSNSDRGEDLALLMILKRDFVQSNAVFFVGESEDTEIVPIGTKLLHVGSLLGQMGANSLTDGIMSQIGRMHNQKVYDQTTVNAFPGSSGGGVYNEDGKYVGMLVRGAGETFNLIVPIRRMHAWARQANVEWALDANLKPPTLNEIKNMTIETNDAKTTDSNTTNTKNFPFLIKRKTVDEHGC